MIEAKAPRMNTYEIQSGESWSARGGWGEQAETCGSKWTAIKELLLVPAVAGPQARLCLFPPLECDFPLT